MTIEERAARAHDELRRGLAAAGADPPPVDHLRGRARRRRALRASGALAAVALVAGVAVAGGLRDDGPGETTELATEPEDTSASSTAPTVATAAPPASGTTPTTSGTATSRAVGPPSSGAAGPTETTAAPPPSGAPGTEVPPAAVPAPGPLPARIVAAREDNSVVVVDTASGDVVRVLADLGGPQPPSSDQEGPGPNVVDRVVLAPDGRTVYYNEVGEPASGSLWRTSVDGGEPERLQAGGGNWAAVSPDGRFLAVVGSDGGLFVTDLTTGDGHSFEEPVGTGDLAWAADSRTLAVEDDAFGDRPGTGVAVLDASGARANADGVVERSAVRRLPAGPGENWTLPAFRRDGKLLVVDQCCGFELEGAARGLVVDPASGEVTASFAYDAPVLDQDYDASGTHLLYVEKGGALRYRAGDRVVTVGTGYVAADW